MNRSIYLIQVTKAQDEEQNFYLPDGLHKALANTGKPWERRPLPVCNQLVLGHVIT